MTLVLLAPLVAALAKEATAWGMAMSALPWSMKSLRPARSQSTRDLLTAATSPGRTSVAAR